MFLWEQAGGAQFGGIGYRPLPNENDGTIALDAIRRAIRTANIHNPVTRLIGEPVKLSHAHLVWMFVVYCKTCKRNNRAWYLVMGRQRGTFLYRSWSPHVHLPVCTHVACHRQYLIMLIIISP